MNEATGRRDKLLHAAVVLGVGAAVLELFAFALTIVLLTIDDNARDMAFFVAAAIDFLAVPAAAVAISVGTLRLVQPEAERRRLIILALTLGVISLLLAVGNLIAVDQLFEDSPVTSFD